LTNQSKIWNIGTLRMKGTPEKCQAFSE
jgi:hypothetical protein